MAGARPTAEFSKAPLVLHTIKPGQRFGRIYLDRHPDPLGYGKTPSRFSDPRRRIAANRFGVLYLGTSLKVCFLEAVLRDQRDSKVGSLAMGEGELHRRLHAEIETAEALRLVDLREDGAVRMGIPTDAHRASKQALGRAWSVALYEHPDAPDGIVYPSRLNGEANLAIYDRAVPKLKLHRLRKLLAAPGLEHVLDDLLVELIPHDP